jgi:hypothetical protein
MAAHFSMTLMGDTMTKLTRPMMFAMSALLALSFTACKKQEAPKKVEAAALSVPATNDDTAWGAYVTDVVKRNMGELNASPYVYYLPAKDSPDYQGGYDLLLEKAQTDLSRGVTEGNMLAFASPASTNMADLVIESFQGIDPGSMKGVKVLFIGAAVDNERVKAAVTPAGVDYKFVEAR